MTTRIRSYSELERLDTFEDRFEYLSLKSNVGDIRFGYDRFINQAFYNSREWRQVRHHVIVRDQGCDLGIMGYEIFDRLHVHHMNPMSIDDIVEAEDMILDPEFLITTTQLTHNAIHFGDSSILRKKYVERTAGDTKLW